MTTYPSYVDMDVWKRARTLCAELIKASHFFPDTDKSGFASNLQTVALSLPSMIAKSLDAYGKDLKIQKSRNAIETIICLENRLHVASNLNYLKAELLKSLFEELDVCKRMLYGIIKFQRQKES